MNMSHFITELSFGMRLTPRMLSDVKKIRPYLGASHERLSGQSYITQDETSDAKCYHADNRESQVFLTLHYQCLCHYRGRFHVDFLIQASMIAGGALYRQANVAKA